MSRRSRQKESDGAVWAGGEEPAQQLYVSRVSVPYGSSALTHRADSPASPQGGGVGFIGTPSPPLRGLVEGVNWHTSVIASTPSPSREPLKLPGLSHS